MIEQTTYVDSAIQQQIEHTIFLLRLDFSSFHQLHVRLMNRWTNSLEFRQNQLPTRPLLGDWIGKDPQHSGV